MSKSKAGTKGAQVDAMESQSQWTPFAATPELQAALAQLSGKQSEAVIRIAQTELAGGTIESLLSGPYKICSYSTFYHKARGGWAHKPAFQDALALARREVRAQRISGAVDDAISKLKETAPLAAEDLRRQIAGDEGAVDALANILRDTSIETADRMHAACALGTIGTRAATAILIDVLANLEGDMAVIEPVKIGDHLVVGLRSAMLTALGLSAQGTSPQRRLASIAVLDRADKATANKGAEAGSGVVVYIPDNERDSRNDGDTTAARASNEVPGK